MAQTRVVYTDDQGNDYVTRVDSLLWAQDDGGSPAHKLIGGAAYNGSPHLGALPRSFKKRHVTVIGNSSGARRTVVCLTPDAPLYSGAVATVNLGHLHASAAETFTVESPEGEHRIA